MDKTIKNNIIIHRSINIGDIFKDADAEPNIKDKRNLEKLIEEIVSNSTDPISYSTNKFEFQETKNFITNLMLPEVRRYSYSDLPSIPESSQSSGSNDPTKISKEKRNILPINIKYFFIDAGMDHEDYKNKDLKEDKVVETFASHLDPGSRSKPNITLCKELNFLKNNDTDKTHIAHIDLNNYGFKESCYIKLLDGSTTNYMYIEIGLNNLLLQCKIGRNENIKEENFVFTNKDKDIIPTDVDLKEIFFKGNPAKNNFINKNNSSDDDDKKYISIMLLLLKELGDTMQAIILEKILENAKITGSKLGNYLGNSCLLTIDTVLATRCSMLSVPFLLKHNHILTSYQPPISEEDKEKVLKAYDKNQKLQEIKRIILNNNSVIKELNFFLLQFLKPNIRSIKLSSQSERTIDLNNKYKYPTGDYINNLIRKIENANTRLREFSEIINNDLQIVKLTLMGVNPYQQQEYYKNIIKICNSEFYIFRIYIYQLNAIKLFKKIEILNTNTLLTECLGSATRTFLFKTKIPNKLHSDTSRIDDGFSLINDYENELFENGFIRKLEDKMSATIGGGSNSEKNIIKSVSPEDIYLKVYPYIYCYPWFIEYMLDKRNIVIIYRFLKELIYKDMVNKKQLDKIFSVKNEYYYFYLSLYNNISDNDEKKKNLKIKDILIKLKKIIKYAPTSYTPTSIKSLPLPQKTNKVTLRRTKSAPISRRFSKTKSKQKRKITTHRQTSKSPPPKKSKSKRETKKNSGKMKVDEEYHEKPESPMEEI